MDEIRIRELQVFAHHGVFQEETQLGQMFYINASLFLNTAKAGKTDQLEESVSYADVCLFMDQFMRENTYLLLEAVAENLADAILKKFSLVKEIELEIRKPQAPIPLPFSSVSVSIRRKWHTAYIALGSNMGDKEAYIVNAIERMKENENCRVKAVSEMYKTTPYGGVEQDEFVNAALLLETLLDPMELLNYLHELEQQANRVRTIHWGPRTLDLDIIFYDDLIMRTPNLTIPHVDLANRDFVLVPLQNINPWIKHPVTGKTVEEMLFQLQEKHVLEG